MTITGDTDFLPGLSGEARARQEARPCGTRAAAERHRRQGEDPCQECHDGERAYYREHKRLARTLQAYRAKENLRVRERNRARRADPRIRERENAAARARRRMAAERARFDLRREVDAIVVERLVAGHPVPHNRHERLEAVRCLRSHGMEYRLIAERIGVAPRQVHRDLTDLGLVGAA